jgi:tetratricopeptide (TPR) repeat protein
VRQYADERLAEFGEQDRMCKRHRDWCLAFAAQAEHCWSGPDLTIWLPRMAAEHDNLRAALSWRDPAETDNEAALRLARLMYRFWDIRGHFQEARERMTALLAEAAPRNTPDRAMLLANLASIAWRQSDYPAARACAEEALERYRELGDRPGEAAAVSILANILYYQGDHAAAIPLYELALDLSREAGEPGRIGMALNNFGMVFLDRQEWSRARPLFEESLQIRRRIGDRRGTAVLLGNLGHCKWQEGDLVNGRRLIDESLALFREIQDPIGIASALQSRGDFAIELEDDVLSRTSFVECLEIRRRRGDKWGISVVLISFVRLALRQGDPERAARCFGASLRLREQIGSAISAVERGAMDDLEARLREALGAEHFEAAYREGDGWNLDEAVDYVLQNSL